MDREHDGARFATRAPGADGRAAPGLPDAPRPGAARRARPIASGSTRRPGRRFPFPVPNGWFVVAESADLELGEVSGALLLRRDLVLFRGDDGVAHLVDAHCPHLGAHLAVGGRVDGGCLRCPFHGWRFDGEPTAAASRSPTPSATASRPGPDPVPTRSSSATAWCGPGTTPPDGAPFYEVPSVPELADPDWSPPVLKEFEIAVAAEDMAENNVDYAHFQYVHGTEAIPETDFVVEGTYKRTVSADGKLAREGFGLGLGVVRVVGYTTFLSSTTPIDEEHVHVRWLFTSPRSIGEAAQREAADTFAAGVSQDIPDLGEQDLPLAARARPGRAADPRPRRWARQFYSDEVLAGGARRPTTTTTPRPPGAER